MAHWLLHSIPASVSESRAIMAQDPVTLAELGLQVSKKRLVPMQFWPVERFGRLQTFCSSQSYHIHLAVAGNSGTTSASFLTSETVRCRESI